MINFCEHLRHLRRGPVIGSWPKTDHEKPRIIDAIRWQVPLRGRRSICCREAPILAWHDDHGEVRHADRVDVGNRRDALVTGGGSLHIESIAESAGLPQRLPYPS